MTQLPPDEQKELIKQAIKEWLNEQYQAFGFFMLKSLFVAAIGSFLYYYIAVRGGKFP